MVNAKTIRHRVRQICEEGDADQLTARKIRARLAEDLELSEDMTKKYKKAINEEIETFISRAAGGQDDGGDGNYNPGLDDISEGDEDDEEEEDKGSTKAGSKRKKEASQGKSSKRSRTEPSKEEDGTSFALSDKIRVSVRTFNGRVLVDLRDYYKNRETGEMCPTKKGIALAPPQWGALVPHLPGLTARLEAGEAGGPHVDLGGNRRAYVSDYGNRLSVQVRDFYTPAGSDEQKPGMKGVTLHKAELESLVTQAEQITQAAKALGADTAPANKPAATAAAPKSSKTAAAAAAGNGAAGSEPTGRDAAAAGGGGETGAAGGDTPGVIDLGGDKRVTVSTFGGGVKVDLREWYRPPANSPSHQQLMPGKKGISLSLDDWRKIQGALPGITAALKGRDMDYELRLSGKRKVVINCWKGSYSVNVREFYDKNGQEAPGQKGLTMSEAAWARLSQQAAAFTAQLPQA